MAAVTMPRVPSHPMKAPRRSRPGGSTFLPPSQTISPSGRTTSSPSTWLEVTPYLKQCGPAGVLGDVAAHRGGLQAGRVGSVVEAVGSERRGDVQGEDARLDGHAQVGDVDLEHLVHAAHLDDHRPVQGQRAAAQVGAVAPGHERDLLPVQDLDDARPPPRWTARRPRPRAASARRRRRTRRSADRRARGARCPGPRRREARAAEPRSHDGSAQGWRWKQNSRRSPAERDHGPVLVVT